MTDFLVSFLLVRGGMVLTMFALFAFVSGAPDVGWVFVYLLIVLGLITGTEYTMGYWKRMGSRIREDCVDLGRGLKVYGNDLRESTLQPFAWLALGLCVVVFGSYVVISWLNS